MEQQIPAYGKHWDRLLLLVGMPARHTAMHVIPSAIGPWSSGSVCVQPGKPPDFPTTNQENVVQIRLDGLTVRRGPDSIHQWGERQYFAICRPHTFDFKVDHETWGVTTVDEIPRGTVMISDEGAAFQAEP